MCTLIRTVVKINTIDMYGHNMVLTHIPPAHLPTYMHMDGL